MRIAYLYLVRDSNFKNLKIVATHHKYEEDIVGWLGDVSGQDIWFDESEIKVERLHILNSMDIGRLLHSGMI